MGMVPETKYEELVNKYEELEKQCAAQEETIAYLKEILSKRLVDPSNAADTFRELIDKQSDELKTLIQGFNEAMSGAGEDARRK
jgi:uncharacterized coiled-coil protein SlyX